MKHTVLCGIDRTSDLRAVTEGKKTALLTAASGVNKAGIPTYRILSEISDLRLLFAPEHGLASAMQDGAFSKEEGVLHPETGARLYDITALRGTDRLTELLREVDMAVYDIQDVGARFYTYISTMHYIMEACAENDVPLVIFDRPNPNIDCVAGPIREEKFKSFVSLDPIPVAYGMTAGELAQMINGEGWLKDGVKCRLTVIPVKNYTRRSKYVLPVPPSPNLPDERSVRFYPFLCLFEATKVSEGRGTYQPFTALGYPDPAFGKYVFTPHDIEGMATNPKFNGQDCYGIDLSEEPLYSEGGIFTLRHFMYFAKKIGSAKEMVDQPVGLARLWGNDRLIEQIDSGMTEDEIRALWQPDADKFLEARKPYLIYK